MQTSLMGIAKKAKSEPKHRFRNLFGMLNEANLKWNMQFLKKKAAPGVDKVDYEEYEKNLEENVKGLVEKVKRGSYRAKLVRRKYIPKGSGKKRPLGIPTIEDKLMQMAVKQILQAIYEQDFLSCSYGYRPKIGSLDAVGALTRGLWFGKYGYVVEADIKSFYDNIDHELLIRMLEKRIDDKPLIRLIKKWLKAGILEEDGRVIHPATGTPQGGVVSSVLANIYLHHALDVWFRKTKKRQYRGETRLIRYADGMRVQVQNLWGESPLFLIAYSRN
jgi:RNA-directed DNA polymerase